MIHRKILIMFLTLSLSAIAAEKVILLQGGAALTVCSSLKKSCSDSLNERLSIGYHGTFESCQLSVSRLNNFGMKGQPKCFKCKSIYYEPSTVTAETFCERD